jgi:hypothetical protein
MRSTPHPKRNLANALLCTAVALLLGGLGAAPAQAQESESFRLDEHAFNAGGRPARGDVASSPSFMISLEAIGTPVATGAALASMSFRSEVDFVPTYRPPGEVAGLHVAEDAETLSWSAEPTAGSYSVYRDALGSLNGSTWGSCLEAHVETTTYVDSLEPELGKGLFYLVAASNRLREEGTLGSTTAGAQRVPATPCP